jgi:hypothetical protein
MRTFSRGLVSLAIAVATGACPVATCFAAVAPDATPVFEYRVLTKEQVLELGKKDLAAGLNQLGNDRWELAAVDGVYIFKRAKVASDKRVEELKNQIALLEADVVMLQDRVAWAERMVRKGYLTEQRLRSEQAALNKAEITLQQARKDLQALLAEPKRPASKERPPEK